MALIELTGPGEMSAGKEADRTRSYERTYYAYFAPSDNEHTVLTQCGLDVNQAHPTAPNCFLLSLRVAMHGGIEKSLTTHNGQAARRWSIVASYGPYNPAVRGLNPLAQPIRWRMEPVLKSEPLFVDLDDNPILNKAGDPYDPAVEGERKTLQLFVTRNEANPNPVTLYTLSNSTNLYAWNGFDPKTVKLYPIKIPEAEYDQESGVTYRRMEYQFEIDDDGFEKNILERGRRVLDSNGKPAEVLDAKYKPVKEPVLLDTSGHQITNPTSANIVFTKYKVLDERDFSFLNMDNLFS